MQEAVSKTSHLVGALEKNVRQCGPRRDLSERIPRPRVEVGCTRLRTFRHAQQGCCDHFCYRGQRNHRAALALVEEYFRRATPTSLNGSDFDDKMFITDPFQDFTGTNTKSVIPPAPAPTPTLSYSLGLTSVPLVGTALPSAMEHPGATRHTVEQHWAIDTISLSYIIAVTGSYCTIQLMEQWRMQEKKQSKLFYLFLASVALGGCGIWSMHFTGMNALELHLSNGVLLEVDFELGLTILSFIFAIGGVFAGLKIASTDPFFLEMEQARRKEILMKGLKDLTMDAVMRKSQVGRKIKLIALFSRLWRIMVGGLFAALGVLGMHYLGMMAQRTNADMSFHPGIVALSVCIAFFTANAAFWILFRALTFWPQFESLRFASALIMGVAVCGTHYSGMGAASYTYSEENYSESSRFIVKGSQAAVVASHGSILVCFWLSTTAVVVTLRNRVLTSTNGSKVTGGASRASRMTNGNNNSTGPAMSTGGNKSKRDHSSVKTESLGPSSARMNSKRVMPMPTSMMPIIPDRHSSTTSNERGF